MFRQTIQLLSVSFVSGLLIATQALAAPMIGGGHRPADDAGESPLGLGANQLLDVHESASFTYGSRWAGFGTLDVTVDMVGEEFEVELVDTPPTGPGCAVYAEHVAGRVFQEISEDCDMEALLGHLEQVLPYSEFYDELGDWWSDAAANHAPGGGEDHSQPGGPYTEREDGAGECTSAQGHCLMYVAAAVGLAAATGAVATPLSGAIVGSIALTGAILACSGEISDACNQFVPDILDDLFAGFPIDIGDPSDYVGSLDLLQYIESVVDVEAIGQMNSAPVSGMGEAEQEVVDTLLGDLFAGFEAGLGGV